MLINPPFCFLPTIYPQIAFFTMENATDKWQGIVKILSTKPKYSRTSFCNKAAIKMAIRVVQNIVQPNIEEVWFLLETLLIFLHIRFCKKKKENQRWLQGFPTFLTFRLTQTVEDFKAAVLKIPKISHLGYPRNHSTLQSHWKSIQIWSDNVYFQRAWFQWYCSGAINTFLVRHLVVLSKRK